MKRVALERASAIGLLCLLFFGILTMWVPHRWAVSVFQSVALLLAAVWVAYITVQPFRPEIPWPQWALVFAALWGLVQLAAATTATRWETWEATLDWGVRAALFFVAAQCLGGNQLRRRFFDAILYFGFGLSVLATLQMFTSGGKIFWFFPSGYTDLIMGPFVYRNQFAAFVETVLPLALYRAITGRRGRFGYWLMAAVLFASVVAAASRTGVLLLIAEVVIVLLAARGRGLIPTRQAALAFAELVALGALTTSVVGWEFLWQRFRQADPFAVRREIAQSAIQMVRERPWSGFGLGSWQTTYPAYALFDDGLFVNQAHNDWAQWAVEGGIPLLAAMLAFAALLALPAWRTLWGIGVLAVLVHCLVDYPLQQRPALGGWIFAIAGLVALAGARERPSEKRGGSG